MDMINITHRYTSDKVKGYIIFSLLYNDYSSLNTIQEFLGIQKNDLLESLKEAKEYFLSFGLRINVDEQKGLQLQTDEETKRKILAMVLGESAWMEDDFLKEVGLRDFEEVKEQIHFGLMNYYLTNELDISSEQIRTLELKMTISHYRTQANYLLELEEGWEKVLPISSYQKYYTMFIEIKNHYNLSLTDQDIVALIRYVLLHRHSLMKDMVSGEKVEAVVNVMLEKLFEEIYLDFRKDEIMKESLKQHIKSLIIAQFTREFSHNPLLKQIKQQYPLSFDLARTVKPILEEELSVVLSDDELGFLALHFEVGMHRYMHKHLHAILIGKKDDPKTILLKKTIDQQVYSILRIDDIIEFGQMDNSSLVTKHLVIDPTKSYINKKVDIVSLNYLPSDEELKSFKDTIQDYYEKTLPTFTDIEVKNHYLDNDEAMNNYIHSLSYDLRKDSQYGQYYVIKCIDKTIRENEMLRFEAQSQFMINDDPYKTLLILKMKPDQNSIVSGYHSLKKFINRK